MNSNICPICNHEYAEEQNYLRRKTRHHIFCKVWYPDSTLTVDVCQSCHNDFNRTFVFKSNKRWSKIECVKNWIAFCSSKGKVATRIYPQLLKYV